MGLRALASNPYRRFCRSWWLWLVLCPIRLITYWIPYRARYGFWPDEMWNLGWTATDWMLIRLRRFRSELMGYPIILHDGEDFEAWNNLSCEDREARWTSIIDEAIAAFESLRLLEEGEAYPGFEVEQKAYERAAEAWSVLGKHMFGLWN